MLENLTAQIGLIAVFFQLDQQWLNTVVAAGMLCSLALALWINLRIDETKDFYSTIRCI